MNRRPSYATVAGGGAASSATSQPSPSRSGAFAHLMNPAPGTSSHNHEQEGEQRISGHNDAAVSYNSERSGAWPNLQFVWNKGGAANYWDQPYPSPQEVGNQGRERFLKPSYLRRTRYMEKLEAAHKARQAVEREREAAMLQNTKSGTLSTSSSTNSLPKMTPSHRGMAYEIVEHAPQVEEDCVPPLPSQWKEHDKTGGLEVSADGLELRCTSSTKTGDHDAASARTDNPMPPQCGIYYYEVHILSSQKEGMVCVGFSAIKAELTKLPGWEPDSWAYHGDDGKSFCCQIAGKDYGKKFTTGDVVGCGVNFRNSTAFFTKNGVSQGLAFKDIKQMPLYPSVGMKRPGTQVKVNFGQSPFMFDIDGFMAHEVAKVNNEISRADISVLQPPLDESTLIKELVAQFLRHDGYVDTAKAFTEETRAKAKALGQRQEDFASNYELQQDIDAVNRQHIRAAILEGDIDRALKRTNAFYPHVLSDNSEIYFHLRCRKFIEMMRLCTEAFASSSSHASKLTNGHSSFANDVFGQDMELDEPVQVGDEWEKMNTEDVDGHGISSSVERMNQALRFGKELQLEYTDDLTKEHALKEIFALFAYEDPRSSPTAGVMDPSGRVPVAEELNSAILVSLGKSSAAAIERVCQQTDVLVAEITEQSAPGAFVNLAPEAH